MSRTTILLEDPEIAGRIADTIRAGNYLETAAQLEGVTTNTVYTWLRKGAAGEEPYAAFHDAVTRARAEAEVNLVKAVKAGDGVGTSFGPARSAAHLLSVTRPQRFATRVNVRVREQLSEFLVFLERELGDILGEESGETVFLQISDRWLNREPVELPHPPEPGEHEATGGGQTLQ